MYEIVFVVKLISFLFVFVDLNAGKSTCKTVIRSNISLVQLTFLRLALNVVPVLNRCLYDESVSAAVLRKIVNEIYL